ncbi:MAG: stage II sporulation protein M [Candidatus Aenigmarchaeota archaeon]|nr:stage II sporulation protein M [Candidatus Aenigmarchaeota archaeon]
MAQDMFESILTFEEIEKRPWLMFVWAVVLASIAILISGQIAYRVSIAGQWFNLSGIFAVLFVIIPSAYYITLFIKREERLEEISFLKSSKSRFWQEHGSYIMIMLFYFAGLTLAFSIWSYALPGDFFEVQSSKINQIHGISGAFTQGEFSSFARVLTNNLQVTLFAFMFSLFFGAGAVFIIAWNASILGVYISQLSRHVLEIPWWSIFFLPHGLPEIGGYILAGLAGGILSAAFLRKNSSRVLKLIVLDSIKILLVAVAMIFLGAAIEVYL